MRTRELAEKLGKPDGTVQKWAREGYLPVASVRPNGIREFDGAAVERGREIVEAGGLYHWKKRRTNLLTSMDVVGQTALTYRRIDYWVRAGLISPEVDASGSGTQRLWAPSVIDEINELLERIALCPFGHPEV